MQEKFMSNMVRSPAEKWGFLDKLSSTFQVSGDEYYFHYQNNSRGEWGSLGINQNLAVFNSKFPIAIIVFIMATTPFVTTNVSCHNCHSCIPVQVFLCELNVFNPHTKASYIQVTNFTCLS